MFIIASITIATQQSITLHRFSANSESLRHLQTRLGFREGDTIKPRYLALFVWQLPVMMLRFGIYLFLVGLLVLVWVLARPGIEQWSKSDLKVAIAFTVIMAFTVANHFLSVAHCYIFKDARAEESSLNG